MNYFCEYLKDLFPNSADKVQAWSAVGILALTSIMTYYAKQALFTWKYQEKHNNSIKLMENVEGMKELFLHLRDRNVVLLNQEEISSSASPLIKDYRNSSVLNN